MAEDASKALPTRYGHSVLSCFDVWEESRDILADIIEFGIAPVETKRLLDQSLLAGAEDWQYLIDCAASVRKASGGNARGLDGQDVSTYVWHILKGTDLSTLSKPWEETDRLIALAKKLEQTKDILPSPPTSGPQPTALPTRRKSHTQTSHYWSGELEAERPRESNKWPIRHVKGLSPTLGYTQIGTGNKFPTHAEHTAGLAANPLNHGAEPDNALGSDLNDCMFDEATISSARANTSPYFMPPTWEQTRSPTKRPPPGTVSTVPFAPLTSTTFGIIQEEFAHDPFWLLIAVTFLIRTNGKLAIPMFYKVKERFPTPSDIGDPANTDELTDMIRHLGLSAVRVSFMQKYATGFLENPPKAGVRYRVKNYDRRDFDPSAQEALQDVDAFVATPSEDEDLEAWEIGHMTKGKYAIDSWRIFCRDELLKRAQDWNGQGREPEFQPEWMRVRPEDKELRAYMRWMWMREGWEWDPITGERTVLRDEMQRAVNEGRVEYDDTGGLRILEEAPSHG